jgi:hypothetical protein
MDAVLHQRRSGGGRPLTLALLLLLPAGMALFSSYALVHRALYSVSALWFMYEISLYLGIAGSIVAVGTTIREAVRCRIHLACVLLMGISALASIGLVFYAVHIYRNPWTW